MGKQSEWGDLLDFILDLERDVHDAGVPDSWVEPILERAQLYVRDRRPVEEIYEVLERVFDIWKGFE